MPDLTQILNGLDPKEAMDVLFPLVYDELRQMAAARLAGEGPGHTLQPTALVNEAYLRLMHLTLGEPGAETGRTFANRAHFFAAAAEAMRRIIIDEARKRCSIKRGGQLQRQELNVAQLLDNASDSTPDQLVALDEALRQFEEIEPLKAALVKLRYFAGLTIADAAASLDISDATAKRYWDFAKAWLYGKIKTLSP